MNETRRKPTTGTWCPTLFDKWHGILSLPSHTDTGWHTIWLPSHGPLWGRGRSRWSVFMGEADANQCSVIPQSNMLTTLPPRPPPPTSPEKKHQGYTSKEGEHIQLMYAAGMKSCSDYSIKLYLNKLKKASTDFFQPLDIHNLLKMMSEISEKFNLSKRYTIHSTRTTTVTTLRETGMEPSDNAPWPLLSRRTKFCYISYAQRTICSIKSGLIPSLLREREDQAICPSVLQVQYQMGVQWATTAKNVTIQTSASVYDVTRRLFSNVVFN